MTNKEQHVVLFTVLTCLDTERQELHGRISRILGAVSICRDMLFGLKKYYTYILTYLPKVSISSKLMPVTRK